MAQKEVFTLKLFDDSSGHVSLSYEYQNKSVPSGKTAPLSVAVAVFLKRSRSLTGKKCVQMQIK